MRQLNVVEALEAYENISEHFNLGLFAAALFVSLLASFAAVGLYRAFYEKRGTGSQAARAFPLLGLSVTTLFLCIQVSIPLSLGLLGSLSIIRFRTPVKEPEEVGFILLVIAASVAAATFHFGFLAVLYAFALAALWIARAVRSWRGLRRDGLVVLTLPDGEAADLEALSALLDGHVRRHSLQSCSTRDGATSLQVTFGGLRTDAARLQSALREACHARSVNIFLDRPAGL